MSLCDHFHFGRVQTNTPVWLFWPVILCSGRRVNPPKPAREPRTDDVSLTDDNEPPRQMTAHTNKLYIVLWLRDVSENTKPASFGRSRHWFTCLYLIMAGLPLQPSYLPGTKIYKLTPDSTKLYRDVPKSLFCFVFFVTLHRLSECFWINLKDCADYFYTSPWHCSGTHFTQLHACRRRGKKSIFGNFAIFLLTFWWFKKQQVLLSWHGNLNMSS